MVGNKHWRGAGVPLMKQYRDAGLDMMNEKTTFEDGGGRRGRDARPDARWTVESVSGQNDGWLEE